MPSGQNSVRLSPDNDILAVLGVVDVRFLSREAFSTPDLLTAGRFKEVKVGMPTVSG
jgi:hypothetical protein